MRGPLWLPRVTAPQSSPSLPELLADAGADAEAGATEHAREAAARDRRTGESAGLGVDLGGPCPTTTAELITAPYPPVPATPSGTKIQLEFRAPDHKPLVSDYTLYPGTNQIRFTLEPNSPSRPDTATVEFQGAPAGTTVECVSGPCPDKKSHSLDSFPPIKVKNEEETVLLRFTAPGYRTGTSSYKVTRGQNVMSVLLEKAPTSR